MSKSILVIDTPNNCYECPLNNYHFCGMTEKCIVEFINSKCRPNWCPLKAMPEKYDKKFLEEHPHFHHMCVGWNNCIEEISGDEQGGLLHG